MSADELPDLRPILLGGLTWKQARSALEAVDCAIRREHWCSPVVILHEGRLTLDDDGELSPFTPMPAGVAKVFGCGADRTAQDWMMVPRLDEEGDPVPVTYRIAQP